MASEPRILIDESVVELQSEEINLKITGDRQLWAEHPGEKQYHKAMHNNQELKVPPYMSKEQKANWLRSLRKQYLGEQEELVVEVEDDEDE